MLDGLNRDELIKDIINHREKIIAVCLRKRHLLLALIAGFLIPENHVASSWDMVLNLEKNLDIGMNARKMTAVNNTIVRHICLSRRQQQMHKKYFDTWIETGKEKNIFLFNSVSLGSKGSICCLNGLGYENLLKNLYGTGGIFTQRKLWSKEVIQIFLEEEEANKGCMDDRFNNLLFFLSVNSGISEKKILESQLVKSLKYFWDELGAIIMALPEKQRKRVIQYYGVIGKKKKIVDIAREEEVGISAVQNCLREAEYQLKKRRQLATLVNKIINIRLFD